MGLLVGLPLKIFYMLFTILRFAWPLLIVLAVILVQRRLRAGGRTWTRPSGDKADFAGPVVEVDYEVVDDKEE